MKQDINGKILAEYQVVIDPYGQLLTIESFLPSGQVKCRNGCVFIHWEPERLRRVRCKDDLLWN